MAGNIRIWLVCSVAYFVASFAVALVAHGTDMDQLTSRSAISRAAAAVDRLLWGPYHWAGALWRPDPASMHVTTPLLLLANTLAWGAVLALLWRLLRRRGAA